MTKLRHSRIPLVTLSVLTLTLSSLMPLPAAPPEVAAGPLGSGPVCPRGAPGEVHCHIHVTRQGVTPWVAAAPTGLAPATIKSAYSFPTASTAGAGKTIAIVDAYDDPTIESDLGVFSRQYGLPACTTANGCFKKVNQNGKANRPPRADAGWALEIALDVEW